MEEHILSSRRQSRIIAMQILYQVQLTGAPVSVVMEHFWQSQGTPEKQRPFVKRLVEGTTANLEKIDEILQTTSTNWKLHRMPIVDLSILRCGTYEILYCNDIDVAILINEAVEIAKSYSTLDSPKFINGILYNICNNHTPLSHELSQNNASLEEGYNRLLYWLSATAEGTRHTFSHVCDTLQLTDSMRPIQSILRQLILLGHAESSGSGQKWSICPTTLVRCAVDPDVCFLAGQQTPILIEQLKEQLDLESNSQPGYQGPSCMKLHGASRENISLNGFCIENAEVASVQLAQLLPDLEGWKDFLPAIDRLSTTTYNVEIWNGRKYMQCDNFYERHGKYFGESGMYRLTKKEGSNPYPINLYFDRLNQRWLRGDWYGLRFLAYNAAGRDYEVKYDSSANEILIPVEERWPLLYERALVLASGMLPVQSGNRKSLRYSGVPSELAQQLTQKLNISIMEI